MKFASTFTAVNACDQRIKGSVDIDEVTLTFSELKIESAKDSYKLYFTSKTEISNLIEMLVAMEKAME